MGDLSRFLAQNALKAENVKFVASKRFLDEGKKPMEWEIQAIASTEDESLRKACTKRVPIVGKKGQYTQETDYNLYLGKLAARCTVFPNLNAQELQDSYHVMGADALLKAMLTAGEYANYLEKVQEVNGFDAPIDELVEDAKN
ncbi:phage portal protein [Enterocloster citroniae]|uniref:phage tail assembly chaperone n=1 Tax=Enterocloster citroniae TaxID=358743 RepID=UPI0032C07ECD